MNQYDLVAKGSVGQYMSYPDHNDLANLDRRLMVLACKEARARYLATAQEADFGAITLYMSKHDTQLRLREARRIAMEG